MESESKTQVSVPRASAPRRARNKFVEDQLGRVRSSAERAGAAEPPAEMRAQFGGAELDDEAWANVVAANPEVLLRFISSNAKHARPGQRLANGPALVARRGPVLAPARYRGCLLIQSLNAFGDDTVLLAASFGRFLRNAAVSGFSPSAATVLITGVSWASRNKSIRNAMLSPADAECALAENLRGREALCELVGLEPVVCNLAERAPRSRERTVSEATLQEFAGRLKTLVRTLWPDLYDRPLQSHEKARIALAPSGEWPAEMAALKNIAEHQGRFSEEYFLYFWAQMQFQGPEFCEFLKIAPVSEHRFDEPMFQIRPEACGMDALYLPHYTLAKRRILSYSTEHIDLTGKTKDEVAATLVTLRECRTRSAAGKLANLLAQTSRIDAMRLFVDVVSFYALGVVPTLGPVEEIDAALAAVDVQLYESALAASTRDPLRAGAREWSDALFEAHRDDRRMPFFFQPFFWQSPSGAGPADARTDEVDRVARFIVAVGRWVSQRTSL